MASSNMSKQWVSKKKTVNLSEKTVQALEFVAEKTGKTETQVINDSVQQEAIRLGWVR